MTPRSRRIARLVPAAAAAGMLAVLSTACASPSQEVAAGGTVQQSTKYKGTELAIPVTIPDVTLTDTDGKPYALKTQSAGKITLVYWGYTHCPDVCPTTMADVAEALKLLPADQRAEINVDFITTDPEEDTAPVLKAWLGKFSPSFVGLTGSVDQVDGSAKLAGVPVDPPTKQADGTLAVDHGTQVSVFGKDGVAHVVWLEGVTSKDMAHDISVVASGA
jgi:protein SCO1/2